MSILGKTQRGKKKKMMEKINKLINKKIERKKERIGVEKIHKNSIDSFFFFPYKYIK